MIIFKSNLIVVEMISWLYGFTFCTFLYLKSIDVRPFFVTLPLLLMTIIATFDVVIRIRKKRQVAYRIALFVPFLTAFILEIVSSDFNYWVFITILSLDSVAIVLYSYDVLFIGPPRWLILSNILSFVSYCATYMLLYSSLKDDVENINALIPFSIMVLVEGYVVYNLSRYGMETVTKERSNEMIKDRLTHSIAIFILFIVCIVHTFDLISDTLNFSISGLLYLFGALLYYITRLQCFSRDEFEAVSTINEFGIDSDDEW